MILLKFQQLFAHSTPMSQKVTQFKNGLKVLVDQEPYVIIDNEFEKPGKGQAFTRLKIKNLLNGKVLERTYKSGHSIETADTEEKTMTYLYQEGDTHYFMHPDTFEQEAVPEDVVKEKRSWLKEQCTYQVLFWNAQPVIVTPENSMVFKIIECEPNVKGDTATSVMKNATIDTGANVRVPGFIKKDEHIKIDTRDGSYIGRANDAS